MDELIRRALMGDQEAQEECTEKGIVLPCAHCLGNGRVSFKDSLFLGQSFYGDKKIIYRVQVICNKCCSRGKPVFTQPLVNPNPYITKWGNNYAETEACKKETERFLPYVLDAIDGWNTRPVPPIGRCGECVWSREPTKEDYAEIGRDVLAYKDSLVCDFCEDARWKDDFCSYFEPKED